VPSRVACRSEERGIWTSRQHSLGKCLVEISCGIFGTLGLGEGGGVND
jgi:hypothetical protein